MRQWQVCWDKDRAIHNYKYFQSLWDGDVEIWEITSGRGPNEKGYTWRAYVVKSSTIPITDCRDPHFHDLLDDPANYRQVTFNELT